jgi:hypothetical protein
MRTEREPAPTPFNPEFKLHKKIAEMMESGLTKEEAEDLISLRSVKKQGGSLSTSETERFDRHTEIAGEEKEEE